MSITPTLFLVPTPLSDGTEHLVIPQEVVDAVFSVRFFIVEDLKSARRFLKKIKYRIPFEEVRFEELSEHNETNEGHIKFLMKGIREHSKAALLSEAGSPAVADPGTNLVAAAHRENVHVVPLTGPSSILLALMASGLSGQQFSFVGYLPKEQLDRRKKILELEKESRARRSTQIFIETPYRNRHVLEDILAVCSSETRLCIACELTSPSQIISTKRIREWKLQIPDLHKKQVVFLLSNSVY